MKAAAVALALACAGCLNILYHADGPVDGGVYVGTRTDSIAVYGAVTGQIVPDPMWSYLLSPVFIVDWPFEVVADTVTLPYDLYLVFSTKEYDDEGVQ